MKRYNFGTCVTYVSTCRKSISEKSESVQSMASVQSRQQVKPAQPVPTNDEQHVMHPLTDDTENFQMETRENGEQQENDFVSYFFKKNGMTRQI